MPRLFCACPLCRAGTDSSDPVHSYVNAYNYEAAPQPAAAQGTALGAQSYALGNPLLSGYVWQSAVVTFSFTTAATNYVGGYAEAANGFAAVSFALQQAVRHVLEGTGGLAGGPVFRYGSFESIVLLSIAEAASPGDGSVNSADVRIAHSALANPGAYAYYPGQDGAGYAGDVWFGTSHDYSSPVAGTYEWYATIHELGHAFGLKHGHDTDVYGALPADRDSIEFSVMTYRSYIGAPPDYFRAEQFSGPQTLMMYDIAALQEMYGADYATNATDTVYTWSPTTGEMSLNGVGQGAPGGNRIFLTIWDGGGNDTYDFSNYTALAAGSRPLIDLRPGGWTDLTTQTAWLEWSGDVYARGNVFNAFLFAGDPRSYIENAIGTPFSDVIYGNDVANRLQGSAGDDTLHGGVGADTVIGGSGADTLFGGEGRDELYGLDGDDVLDGGAGDDFLIDNGTGNDTYVVDSANDAILDVWGHDLVRSAVDFALGDLIEDLQLVGPSARIGVGNALANALHGSAFDNTLEGMAGDDTLYGGDGNDTLSDISGNNTFYGGDGSDRMQALSGNNLFYGGDGSDLLWGNTGNDVYHADRFDTVVDGGGADTLFGHGGGSFLLTPGIELMLVDGAAASVTGSQLGETIIGDNASDWIDGAGGNDVLGGWNGDDTVFGGTDDDTLHGHGGSDRLYGGQGNDTLDGHDDNDMMSGGAGGDTLFGGLGDDQLLGDDGDDTLVETSGDNVMDGGIGNDLMFGGGGTDTAYGGVGNDLFVANDGSNYLVGGDGLDTFWGGTGADTIYGGADADMFLGGGGGDALHGGGGDDLYYFARGDGGGNRIYNAGGNDTLVAIGGYAYDAAGQWVPGPGVSDNSGGMLGDALGGAGSGVSITYAAGNAFTLEILGAGAASITADADEVQQIVLWNSDSAVPNQAQEVFAWNGNLFVFLGYDV